MQTPGWAWQWSQEELRQDLTRALKRKELRVDIPSLLSEALWLLALKLHRRGSLSQEQIELGPMCDVLSGLPDDASVECDGRLVPADLLRSYAQGLRDGGVEALEAPWPGRNNESTGGWIWKPYSDDRQLERTRAVYAAAIDAYEAIVNAWFAGLRSRMLTAVVLPARLVGEYIPSTRSRSEWPTLSWHWEALPDGYESEVDIRMAAAEPPEDAWETHQKEMEENHHRLLELRPGASAWLTTTYHHGIADVFQPAPVGDLAYEWVEQDLRRIRWLS